MPVLIKAFMQLCDRILICTVKADVNESVQLLRSGNYKKNIYSFKWGGMGCRLERSCGSGSFRTRSGSNLLVCTGSNFGTVQSKVNTSEIRKKISKVIDQNC